MMLMVSLRAYLLIRILFSRYDEWKPQIAQKPEIGIKFCERMLGFTVPFSISFIILLLLRLVQNIDATK